MENIKEREELVKKVKEKILCEIKREQKRLFGEICYQCSDIDNYECFPFDTEEDIKLNKENVFSIVDRCSYDLTALSALEIYIEYEGTFLSVYRAEGDSAIYKITEEELNIMLDDNFNVVYRFLYHMDNEKIYNFGIYLSDKYFAKKIIGIFDYLEYRQNKEDSKCQ